MPIILGRSPFAFLRASIWSTPRWARSRFICRQRRWTENVFITEVHLRSGQLLPMRDPRVSLQYDAQEVWGDWDPLKIPCFDGKLWVNSLSGKSGSAQMTRTHWQWLNIWFCSFAMEWPGLRLRMFRLARLSRAKYHNSDTMVRFSHPHYRYSIL